MNINHHPLVARHPAIERMVWEAGILDQAKAETAAAWSKKKSAWEVKEAAYKAARQEALDTGAEPPDPPKGEPDWLFRRSQVALQHERRAEYDRLLTETLAEFAADLDAGLTVRHDAILDEVRVHVEAIETLADEANDLKASLAAVRRAASDPRQMPGRPVDVEALIQATRGGSFIDGEQVGADRIRFTTARH